MLFFNPFSALSELPRAWRIVFVTIITILVASLMAALHQLSRGAIQSKELWASYERSLSVHKIVSKLIDAETGQRGYLLTGNKEYLEPFYNSMDDLNEAYQKVKEKYSESDEILAKIDSLVTQEIAQLKETILLHMKGEHEEARERVVSGDAKKTMDQIRAITSQLEAHEHILAGEYRGQVASTRKTLYILIGLSAILTPLFIFSVFLIKRHLLNKRALLKREMDARMQLRRELLESEMLSRSVLNSSGDCVKIIDLDGSMLFMNEPGIALMEADSFEALRNKSWPKLWGILEQTALLAMKNAAASGQGRFQGMCRTAKGREKWWDVIVTPLRDEHGKIIRFISVSRDITESRNYQSSIERSEANFRVLTEAIPQLLWRTDSDGMIDYLNERWFEYTGMERPDFENESPARIKEALKKWIEYAHPEDWEPSMNKWHECYASGEIYEMEYRIRSRNGEYNWFMGRALPIRNSEGKILHWIGTCTDINLQKISHLDKDQLLRAERAARSEAEKATRLKDEFVASLSHELRTPLNAILGWTQILKKNSTDKETLDKGLDVIDKNGKMQAQLIGDLLDMSRILSGKLRIEVGLFDLSEIIETVVATVEPTIQAKEIAISKSIESPIVMRGDASRVQQIIWNLLSNAVKFTPRNGRITITIKKTQRHSIIEISDTGIGISPQFLPHIFDRFTQADGSSTKKHGGLGLGLSIVKSLVEMHAGSVSVKSSGENKGSTFIVSLPLMKPDTVENAVESMVFSGKKARETLPANIKSLISGLSVLVVDDEEDNREIVQRILQEYELEVVCKASVDEALDYLKSSRRQPDVILSDIGMPERDGYDFIKEVRNIKGPISKIPASALTALARSSDRQRALLSGFQMHISKPIDPIELVAAIASLTGKLERDSVPRGIARAG